jgi:tetratricopeptide (TPR) repeat protein
VIPEKRKRALKNPDRVLRTRVQEIRTAAPLASKTGFLNGTVVGTFKGKRIEQFEQLSFNMREGISAAENDDNMQAISWFDKVIQIQPKDHQAWNNKGVCHLRMGNLDAARDCFIKSLEIKPDYRMALVNQNILDIKTFTEKDDPSDALIRLALS